MKTYAKKLPFICYKSATISEMTTEQVLENKNPDLQSSRNTKCREQLGRDVQELIRVAGVQQNWSWKHIRFFFSFF